eukprot:scaffold21164_cov101-Isochrysis_galbana.AAC.3
MLGLGCWLSVAILCLSCACFARLLLPTAKPLYIVDIRVHICALRSHAHALRAAALLLLCSVSGLLAVWRAVWSAHWASPPSQPTPPHAITCASDIRDPIGAPVAARGARALPPLLLSAGHGLFAPAKVLLRRALGRGKGDEVGRISLRVGVSQVAHQLFEPIQVLGRLIGGFSERAEGRLDPVDRAARSHRPQDASNAVATLTLGYHSELTQQRVQRCVPRRNLLPGIRLSNLGGSSSCARCRDQGHGGGGGGAQQRSPTQEYGLSR